MTRKVLIVDDSATTRSLVKVYLMGRQLEFLEATNGEEGLQYARDALPDLVISDFNMPRLTGLEFVQRLRGSDVAHLWRVPILMLTSEKSVGAREALLRAGASDFLKKPVSVAGLALVVDRLLESNPMPPSAPAAR